MDAIAITGGLIRILDAIQRTTQGLKRILQNKRDGDGFGSSSLVSRLEHSSMMLAVITQDLDVTNLPQDSIFNFFEQAKREMAAAEKTLRENQEKGNHTRLHNLRVQPLFDHAELERAVAGYERFVSQARDIVQLSKLQRMEKQLEMFDARLSVVESASELGLKEILQNLLKVKEDSSRLCEMTDQRGDQSYSIESGYSQDCDQEAMQERQDNSIEEVSRVLRRFSDIRDKSRVRDPFVFPFVIPSGRPGEIPDVEVRVKLDTGAHDNWIRQAVLARAGLEYTATEEAKTYIGAGGKPFTPLGEAKITWYSTNQLKSSEHLFLVHDELPFDVILGSKFIVDSQNELSEPVLPLEYKYVLDKGKSTNLIIIMLKSC
ncbi:hypothetical protein B0T19DRAFT_403164 [Cercophora scortea]|uniref:Peptidase A2 domain-containing protein n=1 Tax=Cercophora scortea TaxID=314031 RepID=A0AAE0I8J8_9PEZI|nr:hypothetical protein B0T19DRAFT_403164 [Cercophora scortea]